MPAVRDYGSELDEAHTIALEYARAAGSDWPTLTGGPGLLDLDGWPAPDELATGSLEVELLAILWAYTASRSA